MAHARLFLVRRADPDVIRELARDALENLEALCADSVVIGEEDSQSDILSRLAGSRSWSIPPMYDAKASGTVTLPSACW